MSFDSFDGVMKMVWSNEGVSFDEDGNLEKDGTYSADGTTTKFGIAFEYNKEELHNFGIRDPEGMQWLTIDQAERIYKKKYWGRSGAENITTFELAYLVFDCAVNQGKSKAVKLLQSCINMLGYVAPVGVDGRFGPMTLNALRVTEAEGVGVTFAKVYKVLREREYFKTLFKRCRERPDELEAQLDRFEKSWMGRLGRVL